MFPENRAAPSESAPSSRGASRARSASSFRKRFAKSWREKSSDRSACQRPAKSAGIVELIDSEFESTPGLNLIQFSVQLTSVESVEYQAFYPTLKYFSIPRTVPRERCGIERGKPICTLVPVEDCRNEVQPAAEQECREVPREVCQDVVREECDDNIAVAASGLDSVINAGIEGNEIDSEIVGQALQLVKVRSIIT